MRFSTENPWLNIRVTNEPQNKIKRNKKKIVIIHRFPWSNLTKQFHIKNRYSSLCSIYPIGRIGTIDSNSNCNETR